MLNVLCIHRTTSSRQRGLRPTNFISCNFTLQIPSNDVKIVILTARFHNPYVFDHLGDILYYYLMRPVVSHSVADLGQLILGAADFRDGKLRASFFY